MNSIRIIHRRLALLVVALLLLAVCMPLPARAARIVRIGYPDMNGFFYTDANGRQSGYIYDLVMECAQLTERDYLFVRVEPDQCYEMLKSGQIDLCVGVPSTVANADQLTFGSEYVLDTPLSLVVPVHSQVGYEDYHALDGARVGVYATGYPKAQLEALFTVSGLNVQLNTTYTSRLEMLQDLENGQIDAAVLNTDIGISGLRVIGQLGQRKLYCATLASDDPSLLTEMDRTLQALRLAKPGMLEELRAKYRLVDDNVYPSLTKEEWTYINKGRNVPVVIVRRDMLDSSTPVDPIRLVLEELTQKTGLTFTYVVRETETDALSFLRSGKADIMLKFDSDFSWAQEQGVERTTPYLNSTYRVVKRPTTDTIRTIAVVEGSYIHYRYTQKAGFQVLACPDVASTFEAVLNGEADGAICWTPDAEHALYELGSQNLVYDDIQEYGGSVSIAVSKLASSRLLPLLNKAISCIRPQRFQTIALTPVGELFVAQQASETRRLTLLFAIVALIFAAALVALFIWVRSRLHHATLQVKARNDYLRAMTNQIRRPSQTIQGVAAGGARLNRADTAKALSSAGEQLGDLASEIEVMNQLDDRTFALSPVPVRPEDVFRRLTDYVQQRASVRGVQLDIRTPKTECPVVMLDEEAYRRICLIIIDNVLSRIENGGQIELLFDLERVRERRNQWSLLTSIGDNGAMLSRQFVRRISERTRRDSEQVLGLRLMTAKRIVQAMDGEMGIRQRPNAGMRMTVRLPVEQAEPLQMMSLSHGVYGGKGLLSGMNILLAEENPVTAQLLYSLLVNEGAHVDLVENSQQVLSRFLDSPPAFYQAILTDLSLSGDLNAQQAILAIRDLPRRDCSSVFIVGMQAGTHPIDPDAAKAINIILPKPLNTATLCRRLHTWVAGGR